MKKILLAAVLPLALLAAIREANAAPGIRREHQAVLKSGDWMPKKEETDKALSVIAGFLLKPEGQSKQSLVEVEKIRKRFSEYWVQFEGKTENGKRMIHCNFFINSEGMHLNWKKTLVEVDDGGYYFWSIDFDVQTKTCINFGSNGYS